MKNTLFGAKKPMQIVLKMVFAHDVAKEKPTMVTERAEFAVKKTEQLGKQGITHNSTGK